EGRIPVLVAQRQPAEIVLGVGSIDGDDVIVLELHGDQAAFLTAIALQLIRKPETPREAVRETVDHREGLLLAKDGRTRVALLERGIPEFMIAGHFDLDLPALRLRLLQA